MTELNSQGREIWFERVMRWSYMPTHWKGVAYPVAIISIVVLLGLLADRYNSDLSLIPIISGLALVMWFCERHSPTRR